MSQRTHGSSPSSSASLRAIQTPPLTTTSSRPQSSDAFSARSLHERAVQGEGVPSGTTLVGPAQPSEPQLSHAFVQATSSRGLGVQSILNPSQPETRDDAFSEQSVEVGGSFRAGPSVTTTSHTPFLVSPRILKRPSRASPPAMAAPPTLITVQSDRRVLTPKSPRAASVSARRNIVASSSFAHAAHLAPGEARFYTPDPGFSRGDIPPLPTPTAFPRHSFTYPPSNVPAQPRRASGGRGSGSGPVQHAPAQSDSPSTTQSPYSQFSQASPVARFGQPPTLTTTYPQPPFRQATTLSHKHPSSGLIDTQYDIGQGTYQMTLETEQGPIIVPVELDVQQASKMADEKRKRNAGASARFRERRKQKERESAQSIASLERDIKEISEERDFYIAERNFFRDVVARNLGLSQIPPRPASPQIRRLPLPRPTSVEGGAAQWQNPTAEHGQPSVENPKQPRTLPYQAAFPAPPSASPTMPPHPPSYGPPSSGPPLSLPPTFSEPRPPAGPPSVAPPPPLRTSSYDPFRGPYDRSWNPAR